MSRVTRLELDKGEARFSMCGWRYSATKQPPMPKARQLRAQMRPLRFKRSDFE